MKGFNLGMNSFSPAFALSTATLTPNVAAPNTLATTEVWISYIFYFILKNKFFACLLKF